MLSPSFSCVYLCVAITSSVVFVWLSITGPPPPTADDINLPHQSEMPSMIMGSKTYGFWTKEAQNAWDNMLPSNGGVVIATNLTTGFHYWAMPAMFHQLKCLRDIRKRFASMASTWDEEFGQVHGHNGEYERLSNCFDLIRQGLLCHADTTLNPVATLTKDNIITDGNILWHTCRDNKILYEWAEMSGKAHKDPLIHEQSEIEHKSFGTLV